MSAEPKAYSVASAAAATGLSRDTIKAAIRSTDPKRQLRAKALNVHPETGRASKLIILPADLDAWLQGLSDA